MEKGIALLQRWAEAAGENMQSAGGKLLGRQAEGAASDQQSAIDEMEKIWDAVIPFHPLLARDLADQTQIAGTLKETDSTATKAGDAEDRRKRRRRIVLRAHPNQRMLRRVASIPCSVHSRRIWRSSRKHRGALSAARNCLALKAEAELARVKEQPPAAAGKDSKDQNAGKDDSDKTGEAKQKPVDPEKIKAGYQKAIELAPRAAAQMERAAKALRQKDRAGAYGPAEEARKILEEIQKAQPPSEQQKQEQKDQEKKKDEQQKQNQKDEEKKKDEQKKEQEKKDQEKKKQDEQGKSGEGKEEGKQQFSRDQIEQALRKVRERQQEKRERDRKMNARVIGREPVEKDW